MHKLFRRCQLRNRAIVPPTRQPIRTPVSGAFENKVRAGGLLHELALVNLREFFEIRSDRIVHC